MKKEFETPQVMELDTLQQIVQDRAVQGLPFEDILGPHSSPSPITS